MRRYVQPALRLSHADYRSGTLYRLFIIKTIVSTRDIDLESFEIIISYSCPAFGGRGGLISLGFAIARSARITSPLVFGLGT